MKKLSEDLDNIAMNELPELFYSVQAGMDRLVEIGEILNDAELKQFTLGAKETLKGVEVHLDVTYWGGEY